jgi:hypothetical protein
MIEQNLQAAPYRRIVALDIETVSLDPTVPKGALDALTGRIVCVCLLIDDGSTLNEVAIADEDEAKILTDFWSTVRPTDLFVGHNILDFDLCYIRQRSWIQGVRPSRTLDLRRFYTLDVKDTLQLWCNWSFRKTGLSLDAISSALGCGRKTGHGENVQEWWAIRDLDTIKAYCAQDVFLAYQIFCKLTYQESRIRTPEPESERTFVAENLPAGPKRRPSRRKSFALPSIKTSA